MPSASQSSTSQTVTRNPRMHGCPERWPSITVMRERSALSVVAIDNIISHLRWQVRKYCLFNQEYFERNGPLAGYHSNAGKIGPVRSSHRQYYLPFAVASPQVLPVQSRILRKEPPAGAIPL